MIDAEWCCIITTTAKDVRCGRLVCYISSIAQIHVQRTGCNAQDHTSGNNACVEDWMQRGGASRPAQLCSCTRTMTDNDRQRLKAYSCIKRYRAHCSESYHAGEQVRMFEYWKADYVDVIPRHTTALRWIRIIVYLPTCSLVTWTTICMVCAEARSFDSLNSGELC